MLSTNQLNQIYHSHLTSLHKDWDGVLRLPCKSKIYQMMKFVSDSKNEQQKAINIVNSVLSNESKGNLYFWSDLHFFHYNIIKYSQRPFESKLQMNDSMLKNYNKIINNDDVVVFGGDIAFSEIYEVSNFLKNLPGHKILVIGNHDIDKKGNFIEFDAFEATTICFDFIYQNKQFFVSHYPISQNLFSKYNHQWFNIHGHTHNVNVGDVYQKQFINMCVENTDYSPKMFQNFLNFES